MTGSDRLSPETLRFLPPLARAVIETAVAGEAVPDDPSAAVAESLGLARPPALDEPRGVFVTLTSDGRLRGCIGTIAGVASLARGVRDNALSAAFKDPRFLPVTADELPGLAVEVSVLTPLREVAGWRDVEIPRHGVVLTKGGRRAVFLPQVAAEQGWDRDATLSHLAAKAGLDPDAWRDGATFSVFEAQIAHEEESA